MIRAATLAALCALSFTPAALAQRDRTFKLDPVELIAGREVPGEAAIARQRGRYTYLFASEANRTAFDADPARCEIQLGGACARMGPLSGEGSVAIHAVHDRKLYLFASPQCRDTFLKAPDKFLERDDLPPPANEQADARGRELVARALEFIGGAAAVDAAKSLHASRDVKVESGGSTYAVRRETWHDFAGGRARRDQCWDASCWGNVLTRDGGAALGSGGAEPLAESQRRALERELGHELLAVLKLHASATISATGARRIGEVDVEDVAVWSNGIGTTLSIEPESGGIVAASWRGRGPNATLGTVEVRFQQWSEAAALRLPRGFETRFEGALWSDHSGAHDVLELDVALDDALFATR